jgi:hypothetical protein
MHPEAYCGLSIYLSIYLAVYLPTCLLAYLSIYPSILKLIADYLSIYLSIHPSGSILRIVEMRYTFRHYPTEDMTRQLNVTVVTFINIQQIRVTMEIRI